MQNLIADLNAKIAQLKKDPHQTPDLKVATGTLGTTVEYLEGHVARLQQMAAEAQAKVAAATEAHPELIAAAETLVKAATAAAAPAASS